MLQLVVRPPFIKALFASSLLMVAVAACSGGGGGGTPSIPAMPVSATSATAAPAAPAPSTSTATAGPSAMSLVVAPRDYFNGASIAASVTVDGKAAATGANGSYTIGLGNGLHQLQIAAPGYATYSGAVQVPGGATTRTVQLFPVTAAMSAWLNQINADRSANGQSAVRLDDMLTIAAFDHAADMASRGYFAHFDTNGFAPTTRSLLLGSPVIGDENLAAGYGSWAQAEANFMSEESALPNKTQADCVSHNSLAAHYCNIVWSAHNVVGLAVTGQSSSPYGTYYDQEFGDLYALVDTTVSSSEPAVGSSVNLQLSGLTAPASNVVVQSLAAPVAISVATLNADPECASQCPSADVWYPTQTLQNQASSSITATLSQDQLYFVQAYTPASAFAGSSAASAYWAGGTTLPTSYASSTLEISTQSTSSASRGTDGVIAPNGDAMRARAAF